MSRNSFDRSIYASSVILSTGTADSSPRSKKSCSFSYRNEKIPRLGLTNVCCVTIPSLKPWNLLLLETREAGFPFIPCHAHIGMLCGNTFQSLNIDPSIGFLETVVCSKPLGDSLTYKIAKPYWVSWI